MLCPLICCSREIVRNGLETCNFFGDTLLGAFISSSNNNAQFTDIFPQTERNIEQFITSFWYSYLFTLKIHQKVLIISFLIYTYMEIKHIDLV